MRSGGIKTVKFLLPFHSWYVILFCLPTSVLYFSLCLGHGQIRSSVFPYGYLKRQGSPFLPRPWYTVSRAQVSYFTYTNTIEGAWYMKNILCIAKDKLRLSECKRISEGSLDDFLIFFFPFPFYSIKRTIEDLNLGNC